MLLSMARGPGIAHVPPAASPRTDFIILGMPQNLSQYDETMVSLIGSLWRDGMHAGAVLVAVCPELGECAAGAGARSIGVVAWARGVDADLELAPPAPPG